jgi:hypothetical protein
MPTITTSWPRVDKCRSKTKYQEIKGNAKLKGRIDDGQGLSINTSIYCLRVPAGKALARVQLSSGLWVSVFSSKRKTKLARQGSLMLVSIADSIGLLRWRLSRFHWS